MSVINSERDLESLCVDLSTEFNDEDLRRITDALPTSVLLDAFIRRCQPDAPAVFRVYGSISKDELLWRSAKLGWLVRIFLSWIKMPEQRLGQLIANSVGNTADSLTGPVLFHQSNEGLASRVEDFVARYTPPKE